MRYLTHLALVLALVAATLGAPAQAQEGTPEGDQGVITRFLQDMLTDAGRVVQIRGFRGALASRATMEELTIADDEGVWLVIRDVVLDWNRRALFQRILSINELSAGEIEIRRLPVREEEDALPSPTARPEFRLPELPVSITIGSLRADRVILGEPVLGEAAVLRLDGQAQLEGGEGQASFVAERIDGREGILRFNGAFDNATRVLDVDLELTEGADGIAANLLDIPDRPSLELSVAGSGPLENFTADIRLGTDGVERVTGMVLLDEVDPIEGEEVAQHFELDLAGDLRPLLQPALHPLFGTDSRLRARGSRTEDGAISLHELTFNTRTVRLAGRIDLGADGLPRVIDLIADVALPDGSPVVLPGTDEVVRLREAALVIEYDAEVSPDWLIEAAIEDLLLPDLTVAGFDLVAQGRLQPPGMGNGPFFDGTFDFAARGIDAVDPGLQRALGAAITGFMSFTMPALGEPVEIAELTIDGDTVSLAAQGRLTGLEFDGVIEAAVPDLAAFSGVVGEDIGGAALFTGRGMINFLTTALDLELGLTATDLSVDVPEADRFLAGQSTISASVRRDQVGSVLRHFTLTAGSLSVEASGQHQPGAIFLDTEIEITDLGRLGPGYGGTARLDARFESDALGTREVTFAGALQDIQLGRAPGAAQAAALLRGRTQIEGALTMDALGILVERLSIESDQIAFDARGRWSEAVPDIVARLHRLELDGLRPGLEGRLEGEARYFTRLGEGRVFDLQLGSVGPVRLGQQPVDEMLADGIDLTARVLLPDAGGLVVEAAALEARGLQVIADGRQEPDGAAHFALTGELDDLGRVVENLSGPARISGTLSRPADARVYTTDFALTGPEGLDLRGSGTVDASLEMDLRLAGTVEAAIANPFIQPNAVEGLVELDLTVQGPPAVESLRGSVGVVGGRATVAGPGAVIEGIDMRADFVPVAPEVLQIALSGTIGEIRPGLLPGAELAAPLLRGPIEIEGAVTLDELGVLIDRLSVAGDQVGVEIAGRWSDTAPDIVARLTRLELAGLYPGLAGRLQGEARYFIRAGEGRVVDLQLASDGALRIGEQPIDAMLAGGVALNARVLLPEPGGLVVEVAELTAQGLRVSLEGRQDPDGAARFALAGSLDDLGRVIAELSGPVSMSATANRAAGAADYAIEFAVTGPAGLDLRGSGSFNGGLDFDFLDLRISGTVDAAIANPFVPPYSVQGPVRLDLTVQGPPALTSVTGTATLSGGRFAAPGPGVAIGAIEARAQIAAGRAQIELTGVPDRGGRLALAGSVTLDARREVDLRATLDEVGFAYQQLFEAVVSGEIRVTGPTAIAPLISGALLVNEVEIRIPHSPLARAGYVPRGLRHVGDTAAVRQTRLRAGIDREVARDRPPTRWRLDLTLDAPGRVFVRGRGLDAELGGQLHLGGTTAEVIPAGSFTLIRGRVDLLGNRFVLTEGTASMVGSFIPFIRLEATTESGGVMTSVILEGEVTEPEIRFASVPELPEDEVLARLIFRRPLTELSPFQAAQLAMSVATLTGRAEGGFLGRARDALGLADLDFVAGENGGVGVRAGRYLTENIYTDVVLDPEGGTEVSINLDLTPSITLRGRTDMEGRSAVGIFYERDY